jgi:DNA integrity scanning protein DisA with diadenylate cyclase activity
MLYRHVRHVDISLYGMVVLLLMYICGEFSNLLTGTSGYHQALCTMNRHRAFFHQLVSSLCQTVDDLAEISETVTIVDVDVLQCV